MPPASDASSSWSVPTSSRRVRQTLEEVFGVPRADASALVEFVRATRWSSSPPRSGPSAATPTTTRSSPLRRRARPTSSPPTTTASCASAVSAPVVSSTHHCPPTRHRDHLSGRASRGPPRRRPPPSSSGYAISPPTATAGATWSLPKAGPPSSRRSLTAPRPRSSHPSPTGLSAFVTRPTGWPTCSARSVSTPDQAEAFEVLLPTAMPPTVITLLWRDGESRLLDGDTR